MSQAITQLSGSAPSAYVGDFVMPDGKVRSVTEMVALETRTKTLNPRWFEGMLAHGYEGVREIESHVTNTFGWSATCRAVPGWVYQKISETYVLDGAMLERLRDLNVHSAMGLTGRLLEAHGRGYWDASPETVGALRSAHRTLEDTLER
jgi:magnesium chelatase subunit H